MVVSTFILVFKKQHASKWLQSVSFKEPCLWQATRGSRTCWFSGGMRHGTTPNKTIPLVSFLVHSNHTERSLPARLAFMALELLRQLEFHVHGAGLGSEGSRGRALRGLLQLHWRARSVRLGSGLGYDFTQLPCAPCSSHKHLKHCDAGIPDRHFLAPWITALNIVRASLSQINERRRF